MMLRSILALSGLALAAPSAAMAQDLPHLVDAYARQLAAQCGPLPPGASTAGLVERVDLNGDRIDDFIVDASRYPCPGRPQLAAAAGTQVTVFKGISSEIVVPALQVAAFGAQLRRMGEGAPALRLVLGGVDCGSAEAHARCERRLLWRLQTQHFELVEDRASPAR